MIYIYIYIVYICTSYTSSLSLQTLVAKASHTSKMIYNILMIYNIFMI